MYEHEHHSSHSFSEFECKVLSSSRKARLKIDGFSMHTQLVSAGYFGETS